MTIELNKSTALFTVTDQKSQAEGDRAAWRMWTPEDRLDAVEALRMQAGRSFMNTQPDFEDFLRLLEVHRIDSMIGGGYAVAYHGFPRFTNVDDAGTSR